MVTVPTALLSNARKVARHDSINTLSMMNSAMPIDPVWLGSKAVKHRSNTGGSKWMLLYSRAWATSERVREPFLGAVSK